MNLSFLIAVVIAALLYHTVYLTSRPQADLEDAESMKRFAAQKDKSEKFLKENLEKQDECWRKIQDLERSLQKLGMNTIHEVNMQRVCSRDAISTSIPHCTYPSHFLSATNCSRWSQAH